MAAPVSPGRNRWLRGSKRNRWLTGLINWLIGLIKLRREPLDRTNELQFVSGVGARSGMPKLRYALLLLLV